VLNSRSTAEAYLWSSHVGKLETGVARISKEQLHVLCRQSSHHLLNYVQLQIEGFCDSSGSERAESSTLSALNTLRFAIVSPILLFETNASKQSMLKAFPLGTFKAFAYLNVTIHVLFEEVFEILRQN
jgi:hypothetical protein